MAERPELPPKYYLDYFNYLLGFVQDKYSSIIDPEEWAFIEKFNGLSEDARCLFIRFANRKGIFFKTDTLKYQELTDIPSSLDELFRTGFVEHPEPDTHQLYLKDILYILTKNELIRLFDLQELRNQKREAIEASVFIRYPARDIIEAVSLKVPVVKVNFEKEVSFLKFLFFGNRAMDMSEFVIRDLGLIQYYGHDDDQLVARFTTRKDAEDKWLITDQHETFETLKNELEPPALYDWFMTFRESVTDLSEVARPGMERLTLKVGQWMERKKAYDLAIEVFETTDVAPSRERRVRCFQKLGKTEEAVALCHAMMSTFQNADELYFAEDFLRHLSEKKIRNKKSTTAWLHLSDEIEIDSMYRHQVELGTIQYYLDEGHHAAFSENHLWRAIFGLLFWDIIFDPSIVAFHHPFQRRPSDLHLPDFYERAGEKIRARLDSFNEAEDLVNHLRSSFEQNYGIANPFVVWLEEIWIMTEAAVWKIGTDKLKRVLERIASNIVENSRGLPDLFVWSENHYEFVEVKSPTDNLSNQQLYWLKYFEEIGLNAKVLRVRFRKD